MPYGRGDANVHSRDVLAATPAQERAIYLRRARAMPTVDEQVSEEQRALSI